MLSRSSLTAASTGGPSGVESEVADSRAPWIPRLMLRKIPLMLTPSDPGCGGGAVNW